MGQSQIDIAALIGSRICHDLISPIGAINNGLELLGLSGQAEGPELGLISESVGSASGRIRFFRIAYGAPGAQQVSETEILSILRDIAPSARLDVEWNAGAAERGDVKLVFLALQCIESAFPYGGTIKVSRSGSDLQVDATADKIAIDQDLWSVLAGGTPPSALRPADVQFPLLATACADAGRRLHTDIGQTGVQIRI
jgi:histidine phosphotransferase ChpT